MARVPKAHDLTSVAECTGLAILATTYRPVICVRERANLRLASAELIRVVLMRWKSPR